MRRLLAACGLALALTTMAAPAEARHSNRVHVSHHRHSARHHSWHHRQHANRPTFAGLTTIATAAGKITVAADGFADLMRGFIGDIVADGYHPSRVHCYSLAASHVAHSLHKTGHACDFNQHGWGVTDRFMYHVRQYAAKWGLRDGCTFGDCGHIDAGIGYARTRDARRHRIARR